MRKVFSLSYQAAVVRRLDKTIHRMNRYPVDKCLTKKPRYPLETHLSAVDSVIHLSNNPSLTFYFISNIQMVIKSQP